jgi:Domain of unknown function (DUF4331)
MSHHFDSPESRKDSRINISDIYLFHAEESGKVIAIMNVSPLVGLPSPFTGENQWDTFRPATAYEFRFDTDGDAKGDVIFSFVFNGENAPQNWTLFYLNGEESHDHYANGRELGNGQVEQMIKISDLGRVWIGLAGDSFFLDAVAARGFIDKFLQTGKFDKTVFSAGNSTTGATNVLSIVAELPLKMISNEAFGFYGAVSANDHGHWTQVNRCGNPNFAATFNDNPEGSLRYNSTDPDTDYENFSNPVIELVTKGCELAKSASEPEKYGEMVARWFLPDLIPFDPNLPASYGFAFRNGRKLDDDFGTVVYTTIFNTPLTNLVPPPIDLRKEFPYVAPPRPLPTGEGVAVPSRVEN